MPQLNPEFYVSQLFWLILTFSFLLIFLWRISLPRISSVLEKRENKVSNDIESAKQLQAEAEKIQNQIENELLEARNQTIELVKKSTENFQLQSNKELQKLEEELNKKITESELLIKKNKNESLEEINNEIQELTKITLSKLSNLKIDDSEIKKHIMNIQSKGNL